MRLKSKYTALILTGHLKEQNSEDIFVKRDYNKAWGLNTDQSYGLGRFQIDH